MQRIIQTLFVMLAIASAASPALARCDAKTCTEAYHACMGIHCSEEHGKNCNRHCQPLYQQCLQTGEFYGRRCQRKSLIKS